MVKGNRIRLRIIFMFGVIFVVVGYLIMSNINTLAGALINIVGQILILDAIITAIVRKVRGSKSYKVSG